MVNDLFYEKINRKNMNLKHIKSIQGWLMYILKLERIQLSS